MKSIFALSLLWLFTLESFAQDAKPKYGPKENPIATPLSKDHKSLTLGKQYDFWSLIPYYVGQQNECSCSVAVAVNALNAILAKKFDNADDRFLTHKTLLYRLRNTSWPKKTTPDSEGHCDGVTLKEFAELMQEAISNLKLRRCETEVHPVEEVSESELQKFEAVLKANQSSSKDFIILNVDQKAFTDDSSAGHFVVVGAWDDEQKRVLILDPDREWYEPYWVSLQAVMKGMNTHDSDNAAEWRGYFRISCL